MTIIFYRSTEMPDYYFLYSGAWVGIPEETLQCFTHTGKHENSGYPHIDIEMGYILKAKLQRGNIPEYTLNEEFYKFLINNVSTNHIPHERFNVYKYSAWHEFKTFEPEKWLKAFEDFKDQQVREQKKNAPPVQLKLF